MPKSRRILSITRTTPSWTLVPLRCRWMSKTPAVILQRNEPAPTAVGDTDRFVGERPVRGEGRRPALAILDLDLVRVSDDLPVVHALELLRFVSVLRRRRRVQVRSGRWRSSPDLGELPAIAGRPRNWTTSIFTTGCALTQLNSVHLVLTENHAALAYPPRCARRSTRSAASGPPPTGGTAWSSCTPWSCRLTYGPGSLT